MPTVSGTTGLPAGFAAAPAVGTATGTAAVREPSKTLDKEAFLKLLVAQMRYQDPSSPMDTTQMMNQTTQLTTVEQLTALVSTSQAAFATQQQLSSSALVGQKVSWTDPTTKATGVGVVSAVRFTDDGPVLRVGTADVAMGHVTGVTTA
ncbi:flagellar hook assembly protein FlgD [Pseudokineococcus lusitanus]|uniref:Flagellar basal-body rod modification protein FlgD n=1 Tax=Pseudokineococcus lusitanus TaxID=763993 RepID=A0A3N1HQP5_9ACTN|nr:flagellar hook capping FlgD N-terminal domain-containing protein [Pseudokineococcus lusitanus]ROP44833.1 flagellar basal-body rod modification protein FlgD [Pseudokineococcus lusitanus]